MKLSNQQADAVAAIEQWRREGSRQVFLLHGYAGTGKTTILKAINPSGVAWCAPTGKAAAVMAAKGLTGARTIHSMIYKPVIAVGPVEVQLRELQRQLPNVDDAARALIAEQINCLRASLAGPQFMPAEAGGGASLIVVDECSMVNERLAADLCNLDAKILAVGDPAQLPPVIGRPGFGDAPDVLLTHIHRQAEDSPVVKLATAVRRGDPISGMQGVVSRVTPEAALDADQIIVGRNNTRKATNDRVRELRGLGASPYPESGERVIVLRNSRDYGVANGDMGVCVSSADVYDDVVYITVRLDAGGIVNLPTPIGPWYTGSAIDYDRDTVPCTYGYAITAHKAQGSEFDNVLVIDQSAAFGADAGAWLYTAITRARSSVTVVVSQ